MRRGALWRGMKSWAEMIGAVNELGHRSEAERWRLITWRGMMELMIRPLHMLNTEYTTDMMMMMMITIVNLLPSFADVLE